MGNNQAYTDWERTVIMLHNHGVLNEEILADLMEQYRGSDIDSGGMRGTLSKDGLDCEEITLKVFGVPIPKKPKLPKDHRKWTPEEEALNEKYWEERDAAFAAISDRFGWM
jgi:hypothetical protein